MNFPVILIIAVLIIYLVWKLMDTGNKKKPEQKRFSIRKHRSKKLNDDEEDE